MYNVNVNVNLMEKNVYQINGGITINVDVSLKNIIYVKKTIFGILLLALMKMKNAWQVLWMIQLLRVIKLKKKQKQFQ